MLTPVSVSELVEAQAVDFVRDEHLALLFWKFFDGRVEFLQQNAPRIRRFGSRIRRRQQLFERQ